MSSRPAHAAIGPGRVCVVTQVAAVRVPIAAAACQCDEDWHPGKRCHSNLLLASQPSITARPPPLSAVWAQPRKQTRGCGTALGCEGGESAIRKSGAGAFPPQPTRREGGLGASAGKQAGARKEREGE